MASLPGPTPIHSNLTPMSSWMRAMYFLAFSGRSSHIRACTNNSISEEMHQSSWSATYKGPMYAAVVLVWRMTPKRAHNHNQHYTHKCHDS